MKRLFAGIAAATLAGALCIGSAAAQDKDMAHAQDSREALKSLYAGSPVAKSLAADAKGILVFPNVTKVGFVIGGQSGDGVLFVKDKIVGHYNTSAASFGLQAGAQTFAYALFFMSDQELAIFQNSNNFEIGVGPNIVVIDSGAARDINTLTARSDVYAMIFDQKGLMAGIGLQGSKITKLK